MVFLAGLLAGAHGRQRAIRRCCSTRGSAAETSAATASVRDTLDYVADQSADSEELTVLDIDGTIRCRRSPSTRAPASAGEPFFERGHAPSTTVEGVFESRSPASRRSRSPRRSSDASGERVGVLAEFLDLVASTGSLRERTGLGATGEASWSMATAASRWR